MTEFSPTTDRPAALPAVQRATEDIGFAMRSDERVGSLLRTLAASKPRGEFLELGTGTGLSTCWIAAGMDDESMLTTIDNDATVSAIAQKHLGHDTRITFEILDGNDYLQHTEDRRFDFVFADTWPGKYESLEQALDAVKIGGLYIADDMTIQPGWPQEHIAKIEAFTRAVEDRDDYIVTKMSWSTGVFLLTRTRTSRFAT